MPIFPIKPILPPTFLEHFTAYLVKFLTKTQERQPNNLYTSFFQTTGLPKMS